MIGRSGALPLVAGIGGPALVGGCALVTALAYRGRSGEPYSALNHWISELGEQDVSQRAAVFNGGAVIGGMCLSALMASLAATRRGRLARAYGPIGAIGGVAGTLVGLFPMNRIIPHAITSISFFNLTALAIALASADFARRPDDRFGRVEAGFGVLSTAAFVAFGIVAFDAIRRQGLAALEAPVVRETVSPLTTLEWASLLSFMAWILATSASWTRASA